MESSVKGIFNDINSIIPLAQLFHLCPLYFRFTRDLKHLKKMADYSSCDSSNLNEFLSAIHPDFCAYTYTLINNHVDKDTLRKCISEESLEECGITNSIHRKRIMEALKGKSFMKYV